MNRIVKSIEIGFENLDFVVIPNEYFLSFSLNDVKTKTHCVARKFVNNYQIATNTVLALKKEVNDDFEKFNADVHIVQSEGCSLFERIIQYKDIVDIKVIYEDGSAESFFVDWDEEDMKEYINKLQSAFINEDGNLIVKIGRE